MLALRPACGGTMADGGCRLVIRADNPADALTVARLWRLIREAAAEAGGVAAGVAAVLGQINAAERIAAMVAGDDARPLDGSVYW